MEVVGVFIIWTFVLYWTHRLGHTLPVVKYFHFKHHYFIKHNHTKWHWSNLLLFNDTWECTIDLWLTEIIPTLILAYIFNSPWLFVCYYVWASLFQERYEHNKDINVYPITSGQWHLTHHKTGRYNYGIFLPVWDKLFGTELR